MDTIHQITQTGFPKPDRIVSSPLQRAQQTARAVAFFTEFSGRILLEPRISEYDMGKLSGQPKANVRSSLEFTQAEGAEHPAVFQNRVLSFFQENRGYASNDAETLLIVCHSGVYKTLLAARQGCDPAIFHDMKAPENARPIMIDESLITLSSLAIGSVAIGSDPIATM